MPFVTGVSFAVDTGASGGELAIGQQLTFTLDLSAPVTVDTTGGTPLLTLNNRGLTTYQVASSNAQSMVFTYAVGWGDDTSDLAVTGLDLNGATVTGAQDGVALDLSGFADLAGLDTQLAIVTTPPSLPVITSSGGLSNQVQQFVAGTGVAGDLVAVFDNLISPIGSAVVGADGKWRVGVTLAEGPHSLSANQTGALGTSVDTPAVAYVVDTTPPAPPVIASVSDATGPGPRTVSGSGEAGSTLQLLDSGSPVGSTAVGSDAGWTLAVTLAAGQHVLTGIETDPAGNASAASAATAVQVAAPPAAPGPAGVAYTDLGAGTSGYLQSTVYTGPVSYLQHEIIWSGSGSVALSSPLANIFMHGGPADDALQVSSGSNVLDGGTGSNFLIGATGADGGSDSFFTDARSGLATWSTIINFHAGDYATLWGFDPNVSQWNWAGIDGVAGFTGATLRADVHGTGTTDASMTFAGLSMDQAQALQIASGSVGGNGYLLFFNQGV